MSAIAKPHCFLKSSFCKHLIKHGISTRSSFTLPTANQRKHHGGLPVNYDIKKHNIEVQKDPSLTNRNLHIAKRLYYLTPVCLITSVN
jgi:hypothetical protein